MTPLFAGRAVSFYTCTCSSENNSLTSHKLKPIYVIAMELRRKLYPIGIQTFSNIREGNYLYIDKTAYVYRMTHADAKYVFLSRPRRFGKSLLTSTLRSYFSGQKELFKGLAIEKLEKDWTEYPVLHFDMSLGKHMEKEQLTRYIEGQLARNEEEVGVKDHPLDVNDRLTDLIIATYKKTGKKVVILIDEYDAPLLDVVHEEKNLPVLRDVMRNFYSPLKGCDPYLRFVFLTGITKFSQLSIFSELNNIKNISMDEDFAAVCGITEEEMHTEMDNDLKCFAAKTGISKEAVMGKLKELYDGYHFAWPSPDIYNPYSLLNALADGKLKSYWFGSGTPTYLIEMLRKYDIKPQQLGLMKSPADVFDAPTERLTDITPLLYQSGYVTIKDYSEITELYTLGIPNKEVRIGLMKSLLPNYVNRQTGNGLTTIGLMYECIYHKDMDGALRLLQTFLSTVPYCNHTDYEGHYQQMLFVIFSIFGMYCDVEVHTPKGRVDIVLRATHTLYLIELKLDKSAEAAMNQIDLKQYPQRFQLCKLPIVKVGINFNSESHTLENWKIEPFQN